jgi:hypothetical protein
MNLMIVNIRTIMIRDTLTLTGAGLERPFTFITALECPTWISDWAKTFEEDGGFCQSLSTYTRTFLFPSL